MAKNGKNKELVIYQGKSGKIEFRGDFERDTIWATLDQISDLFDRDKSVISRHLKNIFGSGELERKSVVANFATTASDGKTYKVDYYNLDAILSVGYRVNSKNATRFRRWANEVLKDHLIKGYSINKKRLENTKTKLAELEKAVELITSVKNKRLSSDEAQGLLHIVKDYTRSWTTLLKYDNEELEVKASKKKAKTISYEEAREALGILKNDLMKRKEASDIFAQERRDGLEGILKSIEQSFGGKEVYPTLEEKAAHLLYFVIKNHPFVDGNKRSASFLFIEFLNRNNHLYRKNGEKKINDNALVALALLIAESDPKDKEQMVALTTNLIA